MKPTIRLPTRGRPWHLCQRPGTDSAPPRWTVGFTSSAEGPRPAGRSAPSTRCSPPEPRPSRYWYVSKSVRYLEGRGSGGEHLVDGAERPAGRGASAAHVNPTAHRGAGESSSGHSGS